METLFLKGMRWDCPDSDEFPFNLPVVRGNRELKFSQRVTFLVGENGSGKSTLLEAIAVAMGFNPEGGSKNFNFSTRDSHSVLSDYVTPIRGPRAPKDGYFLRTENLYNMASYIDEIGGQYSYGGVSLHDMSHGESLLAMLQHRFSPKGIYLFDEPECALSPIGLFKLLRLIHDLAAEGAQFIIATHSPIILACPGAEVLEFSGQEILPVDYKDSEPYLLYKRFFEDEGFVQRIIQ